MPSENSKMETPLMRKAGENKNSISELLKILCCPK